MGKKKYVENFDLQTLWANFQAFVLLTYNSVQTAIGPVNMIHGIHFGFAFSQRIFDQLLTKI